MATVGIRRAMDQALPQIEVMAWTLTALLGILVIAEFSVLTVTVFALWLVLYLLARRRMKTWIPPK